MAASLPSPVPSSSSPWPQADASRLRLYQLISPALPVGAFSYSEGLEVLVQGGRLADAAALEAWLTAELERGALRLEAASLPGLQALLSRWCHLSGINQAPSPQARADESRLPLSTTPDGPVGSEAAAACRLELLDRDGWLLAQRESAELRAQQRQMGGSLLQLLADLGWSLPQPCRLAWPAAFAWAGHCLELPSSSLVEAYLYGWVANQLSAAVRLVPLGPTEAQRLQLRLAPTISRQAGLLSCSDPLQLWSGGVGAGLAQLGHSGLYSRLFRS